MMDKNKDLRRTAAISTVAGFQRRRQRVTTFRDSTDDDRQMELKETLRLRDRELLQKKDRDRGFPKRRRVDSNRISHSSDEEYFEEDEETRTDQLRPGYSSLSNNRLGFRNALRSSPALRTNVDELLGVPIPRRARSASAKKLLEYRDSGSSGLREDLRRRKSTLSPATGSPIGSGGALAPPYSGVSMKKKMRYVASKSKSPSLIQDDIEIEVAEALFDLLTQSHSRPQISVGEVKVYRDGTNTAAGELKSLKGGHGEVEKDEFKVQDVESIKANTEIFLSESMNNKGGEKDKFRDEPAQESGSGDGFVDTVKVGSPKEGESSCVKGNARDIQDPTVTKGDCAAIVVEANNKETRIVIDLMELPSSPSSPDRDVLLDTGLKVMTHDVQKKTEATPKIGVLSDYRSPILKLEKKPRHDDISSVDDSTCQQPPGRKVTDIQSPTSLLSFPIGMGSWPCVLPHPGYMPSLSARSSMTMQPPQFKFVQPRTKRCSTHRLIADNIHLHQQLVTESVSSSSGPAIGGGVATLYGTKQFSLKSMVPTHRLPHGKEKSSNINTPADFNTSTGSPVLLQQVSNQAPAHNILQTSGFSFALGHHQTSMNASANSLCGPPQSASSRKLPANSSFPEAPSTPGTFNQHHMCFPSNEDAASYMAILQSGGRPIPIPTNIHLPSFKGAPSVLNSSFYSPPIFSIPQIQHPPSQMIRTPTGDTKFLPKPEKNSNNTNNNAHAYSYHVGNSTHGDIPQQGVSKNRVELTPQHFPLPFGSDLSSLTKNSAIFQMLPEVLWNGDNKASEGKSQTDPKADNPFLANFYLQQHRMQQQQLLKGGSSAAARMDYSSPLPKWDDFPRSASAAQEGLSHPSRVNSTRLKISQGQKRNSSSSVQAVINKQPVVVSSLRNNASTVSGVASQEALPVMVGRPLLVEGSCHRF